MTTAAAPLGEDLPLLQPGDLAFTRGGGWPAWCVRQWTGDFPFLRPAKAGHVAWVKEIDLRGPGGPRVLVSEATPDEGIRERWIEGDALGRWWFYHDPSLTPADRRALVAKMTECRGIRYDWPSVAGVGIRVIIDRFGYRDGDHADDKLFCSEYIEWLRRDLIRKPYFPGVAPGTISPHRLDCHGRRHLVPVPLP